MCICVTWCISCPLPWFNAVWYTYHDTRFSVCHRSIPTGLGMRQIFLQLPLVRLRLFLPLSRCHGYPLYYLLAARGRQFLCSLSSLSPHLGCEDTVSVVWTNLCNRSVSNNPFYKWITSWLMMSSLCHVKVDTSLFRPGTVTDLIIFPEKQRYS